jgi:AP2-associated kinase
MLKENLNARPNIYQVLQEACDMQGRKVPIKDVSEPKQCIETRD